MKKVLLVLLLCGCSTGAVDRPPFRAGVAKAKITPATWSWLLAYDLHRKAEGVESDLWARALALEDRGGQRLVLVSADILGFPRCTSRAIREAARRRFGLKDGELLLAASHTHNGPALPERPSLEIYYDFNEAEGREVFTYEKEFITAVVELIGRALADLGPASLSFGRGAATFGINRRLGRTGKVDAKDPDVPVLAVEGRAVVFSYACHCTTVMADTFFKYTGDYAGAAAAEIERQRPGLTAFFVAGCGGDINPEPRGKIEMVAQHGKTLADEVVSVLQRTRPLEGPLSAKFCEIELPLDALPARELLEKAREHKAKNRQRYAREMLKQLDAGGLPRSVPFPIVTWKLGHELTLIALSGETCVDYALRLKRELGPERTWVAGYATEVPCYIPSERVLREGGYEAGWSAEYGRALAAGSIMVYGWPVPLAPGLEDRIVTAVHATLGK